MSQTKATGSTKLGRDSKPKYLGVKLFDGQKVKIGMIIIKQNGSKFIAGKNVRKGKDYTLYSIKDGIVKFSKKSIIHFDGSKKVAKIVNVLPSKK